MHGYGCCNARHAYLAKIFAENGYEFCGIDQLGFGLSAGTRGRVESLDVIKNDV